MNTELQVPCPWCDDPTTILAITPEAPLPPPPGSPIICMSCAMPMIFAAIGNPRRPLEHEWKRLNSDALVTQTRKMIMEDSGRNVMLEVMDIEVRRDDQ